MFITNNQNDEMYIGQNMYLLYCNHTRMKRAAYIKKGVLCSFLWLSSVGPVWSDGQPGVQELEHHCQAGVGPAQVHTQLLRGAPPSRDFLLSQTEYSCPVCWLHPETRKKCQYRGQGDEKNC